MKIVLSAEDIQNFNKLICNANGGQQLISSQGGGGAAGGGTAILSSSGNNIVPGNGLMALQFYLKAPTAMTAATPSAAICTQHQAHAQLQSVNVGTHHQQQPQHHQQLQQQQQQQVLLVQSQTKLKHLQLKQPTIHQQHTSYHQQHQQHHPYYQNQSHQQQQQQQHQQYHNAHTQTHQQQQHQQQQQQQQHSNHQTKPQQKQKPLPVHALNQNSNFSAASSSTGGGTISSHAPTQQSNTTNSSLSPPATTTTIMRKNNNINTITTLVNKSTTKNINSNSNSSDSGNCSTTSTTSSNASTASASGSGSSNTSSTTATKKLKTEPELSTFQQQERLTFANTHIAWNEEQWKRVVFHDERKFNLDGPDGFSYYFHDLRNYERMLSQRPRGNSVFIYMLITAGGAIHLDATTTKQKPEASVETILRERGNIATKLGATDFVIQDHNWTTASNMLTATQEYLSQEGMKTQRWPIIAHDINIMENLWGWLIREVYDGGRRFSRKDDLIFRIREAWTRLPMDLITNLYSTLPDRMMELYYTRGIYTNC